MVEHPPILHAPAEPGTARPDHRSFCCNELDGGGAPLTCGPSSRPPTHPELRAGWDQAISDPTPAPQPPRWLVRGHVRFRFAGPRPTTDDPRAFATEYRRTLAQARQRIHLDGLRDPATSADFRHTALHLRDGSMYVAAAVHFDRLRDALNRSRGHQPVAHPELGVPDPAEPQDDGTDERTSRRTSWTGSTCPSGVEWRRWSTSSLNLVQPGSPPTRLTKRQSAVGRVTRSSAVGGGGGSCFLLEDGRFAMTAAHVVTAPLYSGLTPSSATSLSGAAFPARDVGVLMGQAAIGGSYESWQGTPSTQSWGEFYDPAVREGVVDSILLFEDPWSGSDKTDAALLELSPPVTGWHQMELSHAAASRFATARVRNIGWPAIFPVGPSCLDNSFMTTQAELVKAVSPTLVKTYLDAVRHMSGSPIFWCPAGGDALCGADEPARVLAIMAVQRARWTGGPRVPGHLHPWALGVFGVP